jgi:hypothetical protein
MQARSKITALLSVALVALLVVGCSSQKEPARQAIADIEAAIAVAGPDAARYVPDRLNGVRKQLVDLQAGFARKDYQGVIAAAPPLLADARSLAGAAASAKAAHEAAEAAAAARAAAETQDPMLVALKAEWTDLSGKVPASFAGVDNRLDILSKSRKLPANLDPSALDSARSMNSSAKTQWRQATAAQQAGNLQEAVAAARLAKDSANAARAMLGMPAR